VILSVSIRVNPRLQLSCLRLSVAELANDKVGIGFDNLGQG
jgi:hypothetical protein